MRQISNYDGPMSIQRWIADIWEAKRRKLIEESQDTCFVESEQDVAKRFFDFVFDPVPEHLNIDVESESPTAYLFNTERHLLETSSIVRELFLDTMGREKIREWMKSGFNCSISISLFQGLMRSRFKTLYNRDEKAMVNFVHKDKVPLKNCSFGYRFSNRSGFVYSIRNVDNRTNMVLLYHKKSLVHKELVNV